MPETISSKKFCTECGSPLMDDGGCTNKDCSNYLKAGEAHLKPTTLPKAPLGRRIGGVLLERFIMWSIEGVGTLLSPFTFFVTGILSSITNAVYVSCRDLGAGKYSIEKKVGSLMVVDAKTGQPAKTWQAFARNSYYSLGWLLNIIPMTLGIGLGAACFMLFLYVVDFLTIIVSPTGRRVGDYLAGTQVVPIKEI